MREGGIGEVGSWRVGRWMGGREEESEGGKRRVGGIGWCGKEKGVREGGGRGGGFSSPAPSRQPRRPVRRDNHAAGEGEEAGEGG